MAEQYDHIIVGAGAAGLSLLIHLLEHPEFHQQKILVLDKAPKDKNDRTWCFWQAGEGPLEPILTRKWSTLEFHTPKTSMDLDLQPYAYKMIRSLDFYRLAMEKIEAAPNITLIYDTLKSLEGDKVTCVKGTYEASGYIFNSVPQKYEPAPSDHVLYQHFKGWFIRVPEDQADRLTPILMDFRIPQDQGCDFIYLLPLDDGTALVEYTSFSEAILKDEEYEAALEDYVYQRLGLTDVEILEKEFGVIPMTTANMPKRSGEKVIHLGIAGGTAKPSTGYTFVFIQENSKKITDNLLQGRHPMAEIDKPVGRFYLYDAIFLRVLKEKKMPSWEIFDHLFRKLPPHLVLSFLNEGTTFWQDFRIRNSMPQLLFMKAAMQEIGPFIKRRFRST